jgi:tRNA pseudouridine55 synthase
VLLIDKPRGPTSFDVVAEIRRRFSERRVGHTGTLDPMATGLLPVCLGEACKLVPFLTGCDKRYEAEVVFGVGTVSGDADGEVNDRRDASALDPAAVDAAAQRLIGTSQQVPPMYSAIRVDGTRLHELARKGIEVDRAPREIVVYSLALRLLERGQAARYHLEIHCGKGTYVRVIAEDLGRLVGLPAHLSQLRRTAVGPFSIKDAAPLAGLTKDARLLGLADALTHLPALTLDAAGSRRVRSGQERWLFGLPEPPKEGTSRLLDEAGELVAVIDRSGEKIRFLRVFVDKALSSGAHNAATKNE